MPEYNYPDHDEGAFMKRINERLAPVATVTKGEEKGRPGYFKVEASHPLAEICISGQTYKEIVRQVAARHFQAPATFKDDEFWFFAIP